MGDSRRAKRCSSRRRCPRWGWPRWPSASTRSSALVALATLVSYAADLHAAQARDVIRTVIGAIPGALPPVIGWVAAREELSQGAWLLFGIVFLWQLPHFLSIAWMYPRRLRARGIPDAARPRTRRPEHRTPDHHLCRCARTDEPRAHTHRPDRPRYFAGALALAAIFMALAVFALSRSRTDAKRLFFGSIIYLPLLWILMIVNRV